ncbi:Uncharacterised protein [Actinomyces bovis]|uniref:Apolipoprotein A1/A4/E domain n=1 Tax=Actinomyces bovis TaxID=1658 RepID=A0ABY1VQI3_9ACTO|nr:hypothetical protein [Actinomyces bovis]SPT54390.1 Uncharacterised protein [Actinomyces bovis]VEG56056.1 Uncharacterised protein [Actinomyces israelii]
MSFKKCDANQMRQEAAEFAGSLASQAEHAVDRMAQWAGHGLSRARSEAEKLARNAQARTAMLEEARTKVVEDYVPRVQRASAAVRTASDQTEGVPFMERAHIISTAAKQAALQEVPVKKKHPILKTFGWVTLAGVAAAAAYVVWQRSQPVEDPWAEEYWADSEEAEETEVNAN